MVMFIALTKGNNENIDYYVDPYEYNLKETMPKLIKELKLVCQC